MIHEMDQLPSPNAIVHRLVELGRLLDKATNDIEQLEEKAVLAKAAHRVANARAFLDAGGAMDLRKELAIAACEDEYLTWQIAEQQVRACKERIYTLREQIEIARSLSAALRSEWAAS